MNEQQIKAMELALEALEDLEVHLPFDWAFDELKSLSGKDEYRKDLAKARSLIPVIYEALAQTDNTAKLYEELRSIIDGGSESFTHEDAVQYLKDKLTQPEHKKQLLFEIDGEMLTVSQMMGVELFNFQQATGCDTAAEFLAQPEQEPVAYINVEQRKLEWANKYMSWHTPTVVNLPKIPLYTTPPQRKPLTDEEILAVARDHYNIYQRPEISFARAIEAAIAKAGGEL